VEDGHLVACSSSVCRSPAHFILDVDVNILAESGLDSGQIATPRV
jgi:hypothetical protein